MDSSVVTFPRTCTLEIFMLVILNDTKLCKGPVANLCLHFSFSHYLQLLPAQKEFLFRILMQPSINHVHSQAHKANRID